MEIGDMAIAFTHKSACALEEQHIFNSWALLLSASLSEVGGVRKLRITFNITIAGYLGTGGFTV